MSANGRHNADSALVAALAAGLTYADAAKTAGVAERTARRRMQDEDFSRQVERARADIVGRAVGCASNALVEAVETLQTLMRSAEGETVRLGAARALLQFVGQRRGDPITAGVHGLTMISPRDFNVIVDKIMKAALHNIEPERHDVFLSSIEKLSK